ncbi:MAG: hypothetical protein ACI8Y7_000516 [Candidatus Woesearchaeota archaeon]|jgi:hypothetical protein
MRKAQASLEFMMTYGWALIVVLGSVGVLYGMGVLDFSFLQSENCQFFGQVTCHDYQALDGFPDTLNIIVVNDLGENLYINRARITDGTTDLCTYTGIELEWKRGAQQTVPLICVDDDTFISGEFFESKIGIEFFKVSTNCPKNANQLSECLFNSTGVLAVNVR